MVTSSGDAGGPVRVFMRVVKEPLVHFLLVGVVLGQRRFIVWRAAAAGEKMS